MSKRRAATSRVEPGADSVQLNPESAPASSASRTERWLRQSRWIRYRVLIPLVVLSAIFWFVRQATA